VEILSLNVSGGQATLQASWTLIPSAPPPPGAPPAAARPNLVQLTAPAPEPDGAGVSAGFSRLLGQLADRIAAQLGAQAG
jgi:hypothetical protein